MLIPRKRLGMVEWFPGQWRRQYLHTVPTGLLAVTDDLWLGVDRRFKARTLLGADRTSACTSVGSWDIFGSGFLRCVVDGVPDNFAAFPEALQHRGGEYLGYVYRLDWTTAAVTSLPSELPIERLDLSCDASGRVSVRGTMQAAPILWTRVAEGSTE